MSDKARQKMLKGYLHRNLEEHKQEIAVRMTTLMQEYHMEYVASLEDRVEWLEMWPWQRWWIRIKTWWETEGEEGGEDV